LFPEIQQDKAARLRRINSHVAASVAQTSTDSLQGTPTTKAYADVRGGYITQSLETLAAASVSTAKKTDTTAIYKPGSNGFATYATGLEGMILTEWQSICSIFEPHEFDKVCLMTCDRAIKAFRNTLGELRDHIKSHMATDSFLAFEILDIATGLANRLRGRIPVLEQPVLDAVKPIKDIAKASLPRLLEDTRNKVQGLQTLPQDGAALPVTTEVMTHLQTLTSYLKPVSSILASIGEGGWSPVPGSPTASAHSFPPSLKSIDIGGDSTELFARYAADVLDALLSSLDGRSRLLLKSSSVQGVFMSNNVAIVERMIRSSELGNVLGGSGPKVEQWRKKSTAKYLEAWREPSAQLLDVQYTSRTARPPSGGGPVDSTAVVKALGSKEKDAIKEKFKNFNASFDDLVSKHRGYKMEREVRSYLAREVQVVIEPLYGRFWDRYHEIDKGKGKYVKYDKSQLSAALASMA
jgi:exocyst complex component 7